jgi:hypothetical protein
MTTNELRRRAKSRIQGLSKERLQVADDFLAYLEERESNAATEELLRIPGFLDRFEKSRRGIAEGKTISLEALKKKVNSNSNGKARRRRQS